MAEQEIPKEAFDLLNTTKKVGQYELQEFIGKGYSGFVFRAVAPDGVNYAVKVIKNQLTDDPKRKSEQLDRLKRQQEISERPHQHPNLIRIFEAKACQTSGRLYTAMSYLPKSEYEALSGISTPILLPQLRTLLDQISGAAKWLHDHHYAHRDIKPSNILINRDRSHAILLDLGVVKETEFSVETYGGKTSTGIVSDLLTFQYSPPELTSNDVYSSIKEHYDWSATSIYQLGVLAYFMLTAKVPFADVKGEPDLAKAIANGLPLDELATHYRGGHHQLDQGLLDLIRQATNADWEKRLKDATWSKFEHVRLEPQVVVLYAGGTIGSKGPDKERHAVVDQAAINDLYQKFEKRIKADYTQIYEPNGEFPFKLEWESLAPNEVRLSENATPAYWNVLLRKMREIVERYSVEFIEKGPNNMRERNKYYLAGIIILHGTDTMAYSAAALTFGMRNLPCPVVMTGSNQPPNLDDAKEFSLLTSRSDVWRNLRLSMNFIRTLGHRYTELFVVFNATVFHGLNLKKVPIHSAGESGENVDVALGEPYTYQTLYLPRKYMFKWVDGFLCNNFYPIYGHEYLDFVTGGEDSKHARKKVFADPGAFNIVPYIEDLPLENAFASPVSDQAGAKTSPSQEMVLVGYESATFPSVPEHRLAQALKDWFKAGKTTFVVSEYGLSPTAVRYELHDYLQLGIEPVPLFGVIKETGVPFVLHLISRIRNGGTIGPPVVDEMKKIMISEGWRNTLPGRILGNPFDYVGLSQSLRTHMHDVDDMFAKDEHTLFDTFKGRMQAYEEERNNKNLRPRVGLPKELAQWFILRGCRAAFSIGFGPAAFKEHNDTGITLSRFFFKQVAHLAKGTEIEDLELWVEINDQDRQIRVQKQVENVMNEFCNRLKLMGVVNASNRTFKIEKNNTQYVLTLEIRCEQGDHLAAASAYAAKQFDPKEITFFRTLQEGTRDNETVAQYLLGLEGSLRRLAEETWNHPTIQPMGWLILGIFKGLLFELLFAMQFDSWTAHFNTPAGAPKVMRLLRNSIQTYVKRTHEKEFHFTMTYVSRELPH